MERYMPITGIDCRIPVLLIDTQAPLDVLQETADYRIRAATQLIETIALCEPGGRDPVLLQDFSRVLTIILRDGCDVMDVLKRRLTIQLSEEGAS